MGRRFRVCSKRSNDKHWITAHSIQFRRSATANAPDFSPQRHGERAGLFAQLGRKIVLELIHIHPDARRSQRTRRPCPLSFPPERRQFFDR